MIIATFKVRRETLSLKPGYDYLIRFIEALSSFYPEDDWHCLPASIEERKTGWVPVMNDDTFLRRVARDMGDYKRRNPSLPRGFYTIIANASDEESYASDGRTVMIFDLSTGLVRMEIIEPVIGSSELFHRIREIFRAACIFLDVNYACCDRPLSPRPSGTAGMTYFSIDYRTFSHREFLGWMGFVKRPILNQDIPEAAELIKLPQNKGTMIVAVGDAFDVHNPQHIEQAQRVEMRLVDLDALPVTDPRFF